MLKDLQAGGGDIEDLVTMSQSLLHYVSSKALLDHGQRIMADGYQVNVIRLHRVFLLQNAAGDDTAIRTMKCMIDDVRAQ